MLVIIPSRSAVRSETMEANVVKIQVANLISAWLVIAEIVGTLHVHMNDALYICFVLMNKTCSYYTSFFYLL